MPLPLGQLFSISRMTFQLPCLFLIFILGLTDLPFKIQFSYFPEIQIRRSSQNSLI